MTSQEFWQLVREEQNRLTAEHQKRRHNFDRTGDRAALAGQPEDGKSLYIAALQKRRAAKDDGPLNAIVHNVSYRLAAQRIVEETHEIASPAQIAEYLREMNERRDSYARREAQNANRSYVTTAPQVSLNTLRRDA